MYIYRSRDISIQVDLVILLDTLATSLQGISDQVKQIDLEIYRIWQI